MRNINFKTRDDKKRSLIKFSKHLSGWGIMLPTIVLFAFFVWIPLLISMALSFTTTKGFNPIEFVGFERYIELFEHPDFIKAFQNTFTYLGWSLLLGFLLPMIVGLLLSEVIHFKGIYRIGIYLPCAISGLAASILFTFLFDPSSAGFLNTILINLGAQPIEWLDDSNLVIPLIVITMTWRGFGSTALIYLSAVQQIDTSYYEAARIDGASTWNRVVHVTLPQIIPSMSTLFVLQVISVMQVFYEPYVMTNGGGADGSSISLLLLAYNLGMQDGRLDLSSACTVILFLIILLLSSIYFVLTYVIKKKGYAI